MEPAVGSRRDNQDNRKPPLDLSHHLSRVTRAREASAIKGFYKYFQIPGIVQLAGGLPNNSYFPFDTLEAKVARPDRWEPTPNKPVDGPIDDDELSIGAMRLANATSRVSAKPQDVIAVPHTSTNPDPARKIDIDTALQYGTAQGYPPLFFWARQFAREVVHINCPYKGGPEVILTTGNTDGFSKCLQAFANDWSEEKDWIRDKDGLLVEKFAYMNAIQAAKPHGLNIVPVDIDDEGMTPEGLRSVLENWDFNRGRRPRLMYTVTMGQNPTSGVMSLQRRREIYALCQKYDILIIEDDPYWYLQYPSATAYNTTTEHDPSNTSFNPDVAMFVNGEPVPEGWRSSGYKFIDSLVPSYVSIDADGRVIRLDTFSKTVAPGCRLGYITAQPDLIERLLRITEGTTQQPSGFVQAMMSEILLGPDHRNIAESLAKNDKAGKELRQGRGWKIDGWVRWIEGLRGNYERRMNRMCKALDDGAELVKSGRRNSLEMAADAALEDEWAVIEKTRMYSFYWPVGGMFVWLRVHFDTHPLYSTFRKSENLSRLSHALWLFWTTEPYRILASPGTIFSPTKEIREKEGWSYFRLCFAAVEEEHITPASKRLADGVAAFWRIKDRETIEKLLKQAEDDENNETALQGANAEDSFVSMHGFC